MKASVLVLGFAAHTLANIIFNHVPLECSTTNPRLYHGCLRGQQCTDSGRCVPVDATGSSSLPAPAKLAAPNVQMKRAVYSTDGTCGPANGNTICDPNSLAYSGGCCSQYGYCGSTSVYCGTGCISGCSSPPPASSSTPPGSDTSPRADGQCGKNFGGATCDPKGAFGGCCSQYGYCGSTPGHCLIANGCQNGCTDGASSSSKPASPSSSSSRSSSASQSSAASPSTSGEPVISAATTTMPAGSQATAKVTVDGTCGTGNNDTICGNWPNGNCCSMYGFCGNTAAHCGAGCQSGNCTGKPVVAAPGPSPAPANPAGSGQFNIVGDSGVPAMHAALLPNGRVMFLDKLENYTKLTLPNGHYAMSSEYDPQTNKVVALSYLTNAFCAGGTFLPDGRVVSLGGNGPLTFVDPTIGDGFNAIRYLSRSATDASLNGKGWSEPGNKLASNRWYASAQTMPDGTIFVASGSLNGLDPTVPENNNPTYEILSRTGVSSGTNVNLDILKKNQPYYMYPFVHLMRDGNLFIFASKSSQNFNVGSNSAVKQHPDLPGDYRTYPNTGGSVLLPLSSANGWDPEVVICGGGAYQDITSPTDASCGRIQPLSQNPNWELDAMPQGRGQVEGTLLPDGSVLWLNGGNLGAQGFGLMKSPTLQALLYNPNKPLGQRWTTLASSTIPRLYHSVATLLLDGTVLIAGSNPVEMPVLKADARNPYPTEFRVENFVPPYRQASNANLKPTSVVISSKTITPGGAKFTVKFSQSSKTAKAVKVVLHHGGFVTHSVHMGQRMVQMDLTGWVAGGATQTLSVTAPPNRNVAPPGPYVLFVVVDGIPSDGQFVQVA